MAAPTTYTLECDPTKAWSGSSEFSLKGDVVHGTIKLHEKIRSPNKLSFTLNNPTGRYMDSSKDTYIKWGDEVRFTYGSKTFYGTITSIDSSVKEHRQMEVECLSHTNRMLNQHINLRYEPPIGSTVYYEDLIKSAMMQAGLDVLFYTLRVDSTTDYDHRLDEKKKPIRSPVPLVYNNVLFIDFLQDMCDRSGYIWYETGYPTNKKGYIYFVEPANPTEGTADVTFDLSIDVLEASLTIDKTSIVNIVVFKDMNIIERDMDSIMTYGPSILEMSTSITDDPNVAVELAQYVLAERAWVRISGSVPVSPADTTLSLNDLAQVQAVGSDDIATGFSGNYRIDEMVYNIDKGMMNVGLSNRWDDPIIRELFELKKKLSTAAPEDPLTFLRSETAIVQVWNYTNCIDIDSTPTSNVARAGIDRTSDTESDSNYYVVVA